MSEDEDGLLHSVGKASFVSSGEFSLTAALRVPGFYLASLGELCLSIAVQRRRIHDGLPSADVHEKSLDLEKVAE